MDIEQIVCSLEYSKKLDKLGVPNNSIFYHYDDRIVGGCYDVIMSDWEMYSAFTVSELLEKLPLINGYPTELLKGATLTDGILYCCRLSMSVIELANLDYEKITDKNAANSCAKLLIYCIENSLIISEDLK